MFKLRVEVGDYKIQTWPHCNHLPRYKTRTNVFHSYFKGTSFLYPTQWWCKLHLKKHRKTSSLIILACYKYNWFLSAVSTVALNQWIPSYESQSVKNCKRTKQLTAKNHPQIYYLFQNKGVW